MLSVIVGENASGKTLFLNNLYDKSDCVYNRRSEESMLRPLDISIVKDIFPDAKLENGTVFIDDLTSGNILEVTRILNIMLRESDMLLLDEIDASVDDSDKHDLYKTAMLISRHKPVYAVTHDEDMTIYADKVYKVESGELVELTREEMLWEIYQDEEMVKV